MNKIGVAVLGATGSVGRSTARVLTALSDRFRVTGLVARNNLDELQRQTLLLHPERVITTDGKLVADLQKRLPSPIRAEGGDEAMIDLVTSQKTQIVLVAIVGTAGLAPAIAAIRAGKRVALASKEVLVMAGEIIERELKAHPEAELIPVDSEHSAIFQCLAGRPKREIRNLWLTASGGAFRDWDLDKLAGATLEDALKHPTWSMGPKVTIDSASLMNKALEMVEARHLFGVQPEQIKVVIHPQSVVHSMVELCDGATIAQLSRPDMRFAIQYALTFPDRTSGGDLPQLDFAAGLQLTFETPDRTKYPAIGFAEQAMRCGGTLPAVMNAANEIAVQRFRTGEIAFVRIWEIVHRTMEAHQVQSQDSLETLCQADAWARNYALQLK